MNSFSDAPSLRESPLFGTEATILPAITLWQPYAQLPFEDAKPWETRTRPYPAKHHGQRIVIHAAAAYAPKWAISDALHELCMDVWGCGYDTALFRGGALGTVRLAGCHRTEDVAPTLTAEELAAGDFSPGRFAWRWVEPELFATPVPCRGWQGWGRFDLARASLVPSKDGASPQINTDSPPPLPGTSISGGEGQ